MSDERGVCGVGVLRAGTFQCQKDFLDERHLLNTGVWGVVGVKGVGGNYFSVSQKN